MDEIIRKKLVEDEAKKIREGLNRPGFAGELFGKPLDLNNPDEVLVAAVFKARQERLSHILWQK